MLSLVLYGLSLAALLGPSRALLFQKDCLKFEEQYNFNEERFSGTWYAVQILEDPSEPEDDCIVENYRKVRDFEFDLLRSAQVGKDTDPVYMSGTASPRVFRDSAVPQFFVRYNTTDPADPDTSVDVVATDYVNYAVMYACTSYNTSAHMESAWVLSRRPQLQKHAADMVSLFIQAHFKARNHKWRHTEQSASYCRPSLVQQLHESGAAATVPRMYHVCLHLIGLLLVAKLSLP